MEGKREGKGIFGRIRSADEDTKTKWLVVLSVICVSVVIFVWFKYFNSLVSPKRVTSASAQEELEGFSFLETTKNLVVLTAQNLKDVGGRLAEILAAPRNYIVEPPK